jgi:chromosome segregation ATPase
VSALDRPELLMQVEERLKALARTLGLDPGPVTLLGSLARHTWKIRHDFLTHETEVDWLHEDRSALKQELELRSAELRKQIAWLEETERRLKVDRASLEEQLEAAAKANEEAVRHQQEMAGHIEELKSVLESREALLASTNVRLEEREALLRRLAGSTMVRAAARLKKITEIEEFKP